MIVPYFGLTIGHFQDVDLSTFDKEDMEYIKNIIPGGKLPAPMGAYRVEFSGHPHNLLFAIFRGREMLSISGFSTREDQSTMTWHELQKYNYIALTGDRNIPASKLTEPPPTPWLGSVMLRACIYITREDTRRLSQVEFLIAAAVWDALQQLKK